MDFVIGLLRSLERYGPIWMIVDRMTKSVHFLSVRTTDPVRKLAKLYVKEIVRLHGVLFLIVSNRDARFTFMFWTKLQEDLGTRLKFSTISHPQIDGQSEDNIDS